MNFPVDDRNPHRCAVRADPEAGLRGHLERGYRAARRERARLDMHCIRISRSGGRAESKNRAARRHGCAIAKLASRVGGPYKRPCVVHSMLAGSNPKASRRRAFCVIATTREWCAEPLVLSREAGSADQSDVQSPLVLSKEAGSADQSHNVDTANAVRIDGKSKRAQPVKMESHPAWVKRLRIASIWTRSGHEMNIERKGRR